MAKKVAVKKKVEKKATKAPLAKASNKPSAKGSAAKTASSKADSAKSSASTLKKVSAKALPSKTKEGPSKSQIPLKSAAMKTEERETAQSTKLSTDNKKVVGAKLALESEAKAIELKKASSLKLDAKTKLTSNKLDVNTVVTKKETSTHEANIKSKPKPSKEIGKEMGSSGDEAEPIAVELTTSSKKSKKYEAATEEESRWLELRDKYKSTKAAPYKMSEAYAEKTPIDHKVLGWGFILSVMNDRLEVLFQSGIKQLISNYKSNN